MIRILECVPNFSDGHDPQIMDDIVAAMSNIDGAVVLHVDMGYDVNRTVVTVIGDPVAVVEAAYRGVQRAAEVIDMAAHEGAHPRIGAADVVPLVPLHGISMDECSRLAAGLGERIGAELGIPVYLYGAAANIPERQSLTKIRHGEYEGLMTNLPDPDFGPAAPNKKAGATAVGARPLLIAFNVNLDTEDEAVAEAIAREIRSAGPSDRSGALEGCRAIGWSMPAFGCAQVSMNLVDVTKTTPEMAFDAVVRMADRHGVNVTGSELVGMSPRRYLPPSVIEKLGLSRVRPFREDEQIIELALEKLGQPWHGFASLISNAPSYGG